ncbi:unnamed protein product [Phaeothamnion confervicola]
MDADGNGNLAPYSYFNALSHDPPMLAVSCCRKPGGVFKDSYRNIAATGELVINIISEWFIEAANHTCGAFPPEVNEMKLAGLAPRPSREVRPPGVAESAVSMECKVRHTHDIKNAAGEVTATVVIAEVVLFHVVEGVLLPAGGGEGRPTVDLTRYQPMCRLGGNTYGRVTSIFDLPRPDRPSGGRGMDRSSGNAG